MKYVFLLALVAVVYFVIARHTPVEPVKQAVVQAEVQPLTTGDRNVAPTSNFLKRPIDRTHQVLEQVKTRNGTGEFKGS